MGIFAGSDTRQNRGISKRDPPGPKGDKRDFGLDRKTANGCWFEYGR